MKTDQRGFNKLAASSALTRHSKSEDIVFGSPDVTATFNYSLTKALYCCVKNCIFYI